MWTGVATRKSNMAVPPKIKNNHHGIQQCHSWIHIRRKLNQGLEKISTCPFSQQPRYGNSLNVLWWMNGQKKKILKNHTHTGILFSHLKEEGNAATCNNMGGPGSEISKTDKDKCWWYRLYVDPKKKAKSQFHRKKIERWLPGWWGDAQKVPPFS